MGRSFRDYLIEGKAKAGSANKLAIVLETSSANINRIISGSGYLGDDIILRLASHLNVDAEILLLTVQRERASEHARPVWDGLIKKMMIVAIAVLLILPFLSGTSSASILDRTQNGIGNIDYQTLKRLIKKFILSLNSFLFSSEKRNGIGLRGGYAYPID